MHQACLCSCWYGVGRCALIVAPNSHGPPHRRRPLSPPHRNPSQNGSPIPTTRGPRPRRSGTFQPCSPPWKVRPQTWLTGMGSGSVHGWGGGVEGLGLGVWRHRIESIAYFGFCLHILLHSDASAAYDDAAGRGDQTSGTKHASFRVANPVRDSPQHCVRGKHPWQQKVPIRIPTNTAAAYLSASGLFEPDEIEVACILKLGASLCPCIGYACKGLNPGGSGDCRLHRPTRARPLHRQRVQVRSHACTCTFAPKFCSYPVG